MIHNINLLMMNPIPQEVGYDAHAGGSSTCAQRSSRFNLHHSDIIFSFICMYTQYWLPSRGRISLLQCYYTHNDDLQPF